VLELLAALCLLASIDGAALAQEDCEIYEDHVLLENTTMYSTNLPVRIELEGYLAIITGGIYSEWGNEWPGIDIFSLADPSAPELLGSITVSLPRDAKPRGDYVFHFQPGTWNEDPALRVLDISDPSAPVQLPGEATLIGEGMRICLDGDLVYVVTDFGYLMIFDASDPYTIVELGSIFLGPDALLGVDVAWGHAFITNDAGGFGAGLLEVVDVADPAALLHVNTLNLVDDFSEVEVGGDHVFVAGDGLKTFLWQGAGQLELQGDVPISEYGHNPILDLDLRGTLAALISGGGMYLENVGVPAEPQRLLELGMGSHGDGRSVALTDEHCFVLRGYLDGWDIPPTEWPVGIIQSLRLGDLGWAELPWSAPVSPVSMRLAEDGTTLYAVEWERFVELDISDPSAAVVTRELPLIAHYGGLGQEGGVACVNWNDDESIDWGFQVIDLESFEVVAQVHGPEWGRLNSCEIRDGFAFMAAMIGGFYVFDLSDPAQPVKEGYFDHFADDVDLRGDHAFVLSHGLLYIYDISDPREIFPVEIWPMPVSGLGTELSLAGDYGYMGVEYGLLATLDLSNPVQPTLVDTLHLGGEPNWLDMSGPLGLAAVPFDQQHLYLLDLTQPTAPLVVGNVAGDYEDVLVAPGCLLAVEDGGLLQLGPLPCWVTAAPETPVLDAARRLLPPHPNPFNPKVTLRLRLLARGPVNLAIHDVTGRRLRELMVGELPAGEYAFDWDGCDARGAPVASGVYFARLENMAGVEAVKLVLLR